MLWEGCQTLNSSWGYVRDNFDWKSADLLVRLLIDGVSKGGNLLLNVGPTGRGDLEPRALERLRDIGGSMAPHDRSIYGCGASEFTPPPDARYTQRGNRLYLHLFAWPMYHVLLPDLAGRVEYAQFPHDASQVEMPSFDAPGAENDAATPRLDAGALALLLPAREPDVLVPVIELFLK